MTNRIIRLCYRKIIDASSQKQWDKLLFESTYSEFLLQVQNFNQEKKYTLFSEINYHLKGAEKLEFLVSAAISGYLKQLDGKIPDITNALGLTCLSFSRYRFEIIESSIRSRSEHRVAVRFYSEPMIWHDTVQQFLLVSPVGELKTEDGYLVETIPMHPFLSICSLSDQPSS